MLICHICGETKAIGEFTNITNFTKYKKDPVQWCRDCQKMYIDRARERERKRKLKVLQNSFTVSFE